MCFRFLYNPLLRILSIHFLELETEPPQKEFLNDYSNFIEKILRCSYKKIQDDNQDEEPFNVFLMRNLNRTKQKRNPGEIYIENNLLFRVHNRLNLVRDFHKEDTICQIWNRCIVLQKEGIGQTIKVCPHSS